MSELQIRPATPDEAGGLTRLAMRSKAHWGYDATFLEACRDDLTLAGDQCDGVRLFTAKINGMLAGWFEVIGDPPMGELANLWVDPPYMGRGIGKALWHAALDCARSLGFTELTIDSDPYAEPFYLHMGAVRIGETASTVIPGRMIPLMKITL